MVLANSPESGKILSMRMSRFSGYRSGASTTGQRSWGKSETANTKQNHVCFTWHSYCVYMQKKKKKTGSEQLCFHKGPYLGKVSWGRRQSALAQPHWLPSGQTIDGRAAGARPLWQCPGSHLPGFHWDQRQRMTSEDLEVSAWWTVQLRWKKKQKKKKQYKVKIHHYCLNIYTRQP